MGVDALATFVPGQRWISETEPELGLGLILSSESNRVTVLFVAATERRVYASDNAPLTRVRFVKGDEIRSHDGRSIRIESINEQQGLLIYLGSDSSGQMLRIDEMDLDHQLQFNRPQDRLFTGQFDSPESFNLRHETQNLLGQLDQSEVRGLIGSRTSLIPHQLYIAHEVASREAPRVLLADEVGLGKTIEAGMIIHHQRMTGRADRVLIIVPSALLHQWLVEMRRRFNLKFSLFDQERYLETHESNPFQAEQLVLLSLDFLMEDSERQQKLIEAGWDLCIVDEAHHLAWSESFVSPEYRLIETLGQAVPGLLLLTATPEQLGKQGHFARLRLLDPDRFHSYERFLEEEEAYAGLADVIHHLLDDPILDLKTLEKLHQLIAEDLAEELFDQLNDPKSSNAARSALIQLLLDRHGTGRVLFRNTRATVKGFPKRALHHTALPLPEHYQGLIQSKTNALDVQLHPERYLEPSTDATWWKKDPKVNWLVDTLKSLRPRKALIITAHQNTAIDLEEALRTAGIRAALFHEGLSIIARDRAAAWFAADEDGAQVLVCSEIGSEGRNFQFAHHLVLFDLPLNPDLLEQRIGRLDRIGQTETIQIHTATFEDSAQHLLFEWYERGLNAFKELNHAAQLVYVELGNELRALLQHPDAERFEALIDQAKQRCAEIQESLHQGRDRLLEINSCREDHANQWVQSVSAIDQDPHLWAYLERVFDAYGVQIEEHSSDCFILRPGEHMRTQFPELPDDGMTITLNRSIALAREDMHFLTWEHPMVTGAIDLIANSEHGNASLSFMQHPDLDPGLLLLESFHIIHCVADPRLHLGRFFPPVVVRTLRELGGDDLSHLAAEDFSLIHRGIDREQAVELIRSQRKEIESCLKASEKKAKQQLNGIIQASGKSMLDAMTKELKRLAALRKVNPNVRKEELDQLKENALEMNAAIQAGTLRLDAVRLIVTG